MGTKIITSRKNWIESSAVEQLEKTAALPDMKVAVGMPDLHPGKDAPIGAVFATEKTIYPHLVGNDIGCGMSLWQTDLAAGRINMRYGALLYRHYRRLLPGCLASSLFPVGNKHCRSSPGNGLLSLNYSRANPAICRRLIIPGIKGLLG